MMKLIRTFLMLLVMMICLPGYGEIQVTLVDKALNQQVVNVVGFSMKDGKGALQYFDSQRRYQRVDLSAYLRVVFPEIRRVEETEQEGVVSEGASGVVEQGKNDPFEQVEEIDLNDIVRDDADDEGSAVDLNGVGRIMLRDGQVYPGKFLRINDQRQVVWETSMGHELAFSLDDIMSVEIRGKYERLAGNEDVVILVNGDRLKGFVDKVDPSKIHLDSAGNVLTIDWAQVACFQLANTLKHEPGLWVNLRDGGRMRLKSGNLNDETFECVTSTGQEIELNLEEIARIDLPSDRRLIDLRDVSYTVKKGAAVFGVPFPPRFDGDGNLRIHSPVEVLFELPAGAERFTGIFTVDEQALDRADMVLVIYDDKRELVRKRLNAKDQSILVNLPVSSQQLRLALEPGKHGPVLDRLIGYETMVLVKRKN